MTDTAFRPIYYCDGISDVYKLMDELEQVGHIVSVENVVNQMTSTVIVTFTDRRVTRIVYKKTIAHRLLGRSIA